MSEISQYIMRQEEKATFLRRLIDLLNVAIDRDDGRGFCVQLIEEAQSVAVDLEECLQDVRLPKGGEA